MDDSSNLDKYLADLGISSAGDNEPHKPPPLPDLQATSAPALGIAEKEPIVIVERFIKGLVSRIDPALSYKIREVENAIEIEINGESASKIAGRDGRLLHAIETVTYAVLAKYTQRLECKIRVDVGGFRRRQTDMLSRLAEKIALQVAKSGEKHELQPMPPSDRRVIHMALKEHPDVVSESAGEGDARHLIIRPRHG